MRAQEAVRPAGAALHVSAVSPLRLAATAR